MKKKQIKTLFLHIGMPKTGSSSIQLTLFKIKEIFGIEYVDLGEVNHGGRVRSLFSSNPNTWHGHKVAGRTEQEIKDFNDSTKSKLVKSFEKSCCQIISGEDIYLMDKLGLKNFKEFASPFFDKIVVVGYVRPPVSYLSSAFQQYIKNHRWDSLYTKLMYPKYKENFDKFDSIFGKNDVWLRLFDTNELYEGDVVKDFVKTITGYVLAEEYINRSNESFSLEAISLIFVMNKYGYSFKYTPSYAISRNKLNTEIAKFGKTKFRLSGEVINSILDSNKGDISWIEGRLGKSFRVEANYENNTICSENKLIEVAMNNFSEFKLFLESNSVNTDIPSQGIGNVIEFLRVILTNRDSNGTRVLFKNEPFFFPEQWNLLNNKLIGPATVLLELAKTYECFGQPEVAQNILIQAKKINPSLIAPKKG